MKASTKRILNFAFIFGTLAVVMIVGFQGNELSDAWDALNSLAPQWILACVAGWAGYLFMDGVSIHYFLRKQRYPIALRHAVSIAMTGIYYSNITPGASGGQPMQIYYLKKRGVPIGIGSSAMTVKFFCFQFMLMVIGTIAWILFPGFVNAQVGASKWVLIMGYVFNSISVTAVLLLAISKPMVRFLIGLCIRLGTKIHLCKDPSAAAAKWEGILSTFHASVTMIRKHPRELMVQLFISTLQLMSLMSVVVSVYLAFGLSGESIPHLVAIGLMVYISAAYTPLPGASGAQEGVFILYFTGIFPEGKLFVALLLWRFFTYYIALIAGACHSVFQGFHGSGKKKQAENLTTGDAALGEDKEPPLT